MGIALTTHGTCVNRSRLFLASFGPFQFLTQVLLVRAGFLQSLVRTLLLFITGDRASLDTKCGLRYWDDFFESILGNILQFRLRRVALFHSLLSCFAREYQQF